MRTAASLLACCVVTVASAGELAGIAGHYRYEEYSVTLPNGRALSLRDLGATEAFLDISDVAKTITLRMTMAEGKSVVETAHVLEARFEKGKGYWVAQWPDMSYAVRAVISFQGGALTSDTRFDHAGDTQRFGSVEHAVLRKVGI